MEELNERWIYRTEGFPGGSDGKESTWMQETRVQSLGWEDPLEKGMATHSGVLAWRTPWTEEPGGLQSMQCRVGHDWVTDTLSTLISQLTPSLHVHMSIPYICISSPALQIGSSVPFS